MGDCAVGFGDHAVKFGDHFPIRPRPAINSRATQQRPLKRACQAGFIRRRLVAGGFSPRRAEREGQLAMQIVPARRLFYPRRAE